VRLIGRMEGLGFELRAEAVLQTLTEEVIKSSEIEGEILDREQVRFSIARRLGMDIGGLTPAKRYVKAPTSPVRCRWSRGRSGASGFTMKHRKQSGSRER